MTEDEAFTRKKKAVQIALDAPHYKVCEGCGSIIVKRVNFCPNCHAYRFDDSIAGVVNQTLVLGNRDKETVTPEDLETT